MQDHDPNNDEVTILLLGDDDAHAELLTSNLIRNGIGNDFVHYINGHDGIDHLLSAKPEEEKFLVLLDLNASGIDEGQVLSFMKQQPRLKNIPVIILTTAENSPAVQKRYAQDCDLYLEKPLNYTHFTQAIARMGLFLKSSASTAIDLISTQQFHAKPELN